jgi:hypothetical protein
MHLFQLEEEILVNNGDSISVAAEDFEVRITFENTEPVEFTSGTCPVAGISASGRYQRLLPVLQAQRSDVLEGTSDTLSNPRIFLIDDANKITIPTGFSTSLVLPGSISAMESIVATSSATVSSVSNDCTSSRNWVGQVVTGGNVKQIIIGNTTSRLYYVIEFDTPQFIDADQILTFDVFSKFSPECLIPS